MFTVAQFFEKQQLRVLAVPASWVRDGYLLWPKLSSNEKLDKLRTEGMEFHGATKKIPVISSRKFKSLQAAEAAADDLLKQEVSDIEAKRKLLKHRKVVSEKPRPLKDYNKIIKEIASSKVPTHGNDQTAGPSGWVQPPVQEITGTTESSQPQALVFPRNSHGTDDQSTQRHSLQDQSAENREEESKPLNITISRPLQTFGTPMNVLSSPRDPSNIIVTYQPQPLQTTNEAAHHAADISSNAMLALPQNQQQIQSLLVGDENIYYINSSTDNSRIVGTSGK
nr:uncharacterized protein LOC115255841 [Aedes albopictus]